MVAFDEQNPGCMCIRGFYALNQRVVPVRAVRGERDSRLPVWAPAKAALGRKIGVCAHRIVVLPVKLRRLWP